MTREPSNRAQAARYEHPLLTRSEAQNANARIRYGAVLRPRPAQRRWPPPCRCPQTPVPRIRTRHRWPTREHEHMPDDDLPKIGAPATRALASIGVTRLADVADRSESELLRLHALDRERSGS
jgi:hypothetical protein